MSLKYYGHRPLLIKLKELLIKRKKDYFNLLNPQVLLRKKSNFGTNLNDLKKKD